MVPFMRITLREAKKKDMQLIKKYTVETGWEGIPESQKALLDREKWSMHMVEVFENFHKRENSQLFVAEDESRTFVGYLFVGKAAT